MPSGRTHDQITITTLPLVALAGLIFSRSAGITLSLSGAFLFSGLMFGPDLDIYSVQYKRWGWLRPIWLPYQKLLRHRSWLSHGPIVGTVFRLVYLGIWLGIGTVIIGWILVQGWGIALDWQSVLHLVEHQGPQYLTEGLATLLGLELGAMSHVFSDGLGSLYKAAMKRFKN